MLCCPAGAAGGHAWWPCGGCDGAPAAADEPPAGHAGPSARCCALSRSPPPCSPPTAAGMDVPACSCPAARLSACGAAPLAAASRAPYARPGTAPAVACAPALPASEGSGATGAAAAAASVAARSRKEAPPSRRRSQASSPARSRPSSCHTNCERLRTSRRPLHARHAPPQCACPGGYTLGARGTGVTERQARGGRQRTGRCWPPRPRGSAGICPQSPGP
jgi:hypothetical protein